MSRARRNLLEEPPQQNVLAMRSWGVRNLRAAFFISRLFCSPAPFVTPICGGSPRAVHAEIDANGPTRKYQVSGVSLGSAARATQEIALGVSAHAREGTLQICTGGTALRGPTRITLAK